MRITVGGMSKYRSGRIRFETERRNVSAEAEAAYNILMAALIDADFAAQRVVLAYDASLAHLQECRFESSAAHEILAASNRTATPSALQVPTEQNARPAVV